MQAYCLSCKKHTDNIGSKKVIVRNKVIRQKSRCANCAAENSRFLKHKSKKKNNLNKTQILNFSYTITRHVDILFKVLEKYKERRFKIVKNKKQEIILSSTCTVGSKTIKIYERTYLWKNYY